MKFHQAFRVTLSFLFCSGLYLPTTYNLVKNKHVITASRISGNILALGSLLYSTSLTLPLFEPGLSVLDKLFSFLVGLICFSVNIKQFLFIYNAPKLEKLIKIWDEINEEDFYPQMREEMLAKRKKTTDIWSVVFAFLLVSVLAATSLVPFYTRKLEHLTAFPYSGESPQFEILCVYELIIISSLGFLVNGYNCFFMQIVAFEDVLCNYLKRTLENIMRGLHVSDEGGISYDSKYFSSGVGTTKTMTYNEVCADMENKLRFWIGLHQKLIRYNDIKREIYKISLGIDYVGLILIIGLLIFLFVSDYLTAAIVFDLFAYSITAYTIFYVTCYYGDLAEFSSETMYHDAFDRSWYVYPRKIRIAYFFIMMRCRKPLTMKALNLYPLNSRSFGTVFNHSYSFLMFLLRVPDRSK